VVVIGALVFDFDGLILETETPAYQAWVETYREFGHELPKALWLDYIGREGGWFDAFAYLEGLVGSGLDRTAVEGRRDARKTELVLAVTESVGLRALLTDARARGLRLGVCSSSTPKWVLGHLDRIGLRELFDHVQCRDRPDLRAKPAPDLYRDGVRRPGRATRAVDRVRGLAERNARSAGGRDAVRGRSERAHGRDGSGRRRPSVRVTGAGLPRRAAPQVLALIFR